MPRGDLTATYSSDEERGTEDVKKPSRSAERGASPSRASSSKEHMMNEDVNQQQQQQQPLDGHDQGVAASPKKHRGPNPNTDYKSHFVRQKARFDAVSEDHATKKKELTRASLKQIKLTEELEFLLDAIAGEIHRRRLISQGEVGGAAATAAKTATANDETRETTAKRGEEHDKSKSAAGRGTDQAASSDAHSSLDDEELLALAEDNESEDGEGRAAAVTPAARTTNKARSSGRHSVKRQRSASEAGTDDELLEAAGMSSPASKRARNA